MIPKALHSDYLGRFREVISDPLNLLIARHPMAGLVENNLVHLHNGNRVAASGPRAYYDDFSAILVINRGVHEPLEEYCFQQLLDVLPPLPVMLELGAYWGHYSMWLKQVRPGARVYLLEPDRDRLAVGQHNFRINRYTGEFIQSFVAQGQFTVDAFLEKRQLNRLDILHADIQGHELEMLEGCRSALEKRRIDYLFISTHSQELHDGVTGYLRDRGYRVQVSSDIQETTSHDGFVFAASPLMAPMFSEFSSPGRNRIAESGPGDLLKALEAVS
jgi:hypothetical protein